MKKKKDHITPPRLAERLLLILLKSDLAEEVLGDLDEKFYSTVNKHSVKKARRNYWYQVFNYLRPFALKNIRFKHSNHFTMYLHYLKISWRTLLRNKVFSSIKIGGFAVGIAACILISLYIRHELSYDKHYQQGDQIYRVANSFADGAFTDKWTNMQGPLKPVFEEHLPEIDLISRVVLWKWANVGENHIRPIESKRNIYEEGFFYSDPELLEILEIPMVFGSQEEALSKPNSMVISRSRAEKYFPNENPIGRQIVLNDDPGTIYMIGGVMEDFPNTSHLQGHFIMSMAGKTTGPGASDWCCSNYTFYLKLIPGVDKEILENKMLDIRDTFVFDELKAAGQTGLEEEYSHRSYYLQPVQNLYLNEEKVGDHQAHGAAELVWIFGLIAAIILLLACLNFINLSTARSVKRAKEVGMRKVVGSKRSALINQHLSESVFYSLISVAFGALLAHFTLPFFNQIAAKPLQMPWQTFWFAPLLIGAAILIGILSGIYPAFFLSRFRPIEVLKGRVTSGVKSSTFRSGMVVFQFTTTVVLIIAALVVHKQFDHYMNKSIGYKKDQVVNILGLNSLEATEKKAFKEEMLNISTVQSSTLADYLPVAGGRITNFGFSLEDKSLSDAGFEAARWIVDEDYIQTMGMEVVDGRDFTDMVSDSTAIIINETMAQGFNLENPLDKQVIDMFGGRYRIVGVVKDFYFESLTGSVRPLAMVKGQGNSTLSIKVQARNMEATLASVNEVWDRFKPNQPIRYTFMDQRFEQMYEALIQARTIFISFSLLSVLVACLGLFALSAYAVEQRSKEVSVRKVLGASVGNVFTLLATHFIKLVAIAIVIAIPIGWQLMKNMLEDMANHITLSWDIFALAAIAAIGIALLTVSYESLKAALVNPAKTLRSE